MNSRKKYIYTINTIKYAALMKMHFFFSKEGLKTQNAFVLGCTRVCGSNSLVMDQTRFYRFCRVFTNFKLEGDDGHDLENTFH